VNYLETLGAAIRAEVAVSALPDSNDLDELFVLYAVLLLAKGQHVTAEDTHNAWCAWMMRRDAAHESIRPYGELDTATRDADLPYLEAIRAVAGNVGQ
jgi:hypothetical protein